MKPERKEKPIAIYEEQETEPKTIHANDELVNSLFNGIFQNY